MAQHETMVTVVCGVWILQNIFSLFGLFTYGVYVFNLSDKVQLNNPILTLIEICLNMLIQLLQLVISSIFWKLKSDDQNPQYILGIKRGSLFVSSLQMLSLMLYYLFDTLIFHKKIYLFGIMFSIIICSFMYLEIWKTDILDSRYSIIKSALLLDCISLILSVSHFILRYGVSLDVTQTNNRYLSNKANNEILSIASSVFVIISLFNLFFMWISSLRKAKKETSLTSTLLSNQNIKQIHFWNLIAALVSIVGPPTTITLLTSATFIGISIKNELVTTNQNDKQETDIFYPLKGGQKRLDLDY